MRLMVTAAAAAMMLAACGAEAPSEAAPVEAQQTAAVAQIPADLVRALYAEPTIPTEPETIRRYFIEEFVTGLTPTDDGTLIDSDYRINGQDGQADGLVVEETASGPEGAHVEARFDNLGAANTVGFDLCRRDDGAVRIVNVTTAGADGWNLRRLLELPETPAAC